MTMVTIKKLPTRNAEIKSYFKLQKQKMIKFITFYPYITY